MLNTAITDNELGTNVLLELDYSLYNNSLYLHEEALVPCWPYLNAPIEDEV